MIVDTPPHSLPAGVWAALEGAFSAMVSGGLPCGAALVDHTGTVIARGRNHAYDPGDGCDILQETPLAHAELNVLAQVSTTRDLANDTLWSTQQPCAMCAAAISFCGVGHVRFLAADPAFVATADSRAGTPFDPTVENPELTVWLILANALFLQPAIQRGDEDRLERNRRVEPETVDAATRIALAPPLEALDAFVASNWSFLVPLADRRRQRHDAWRNT